MENTNTGVPLESKLDKYLREKREREQIDRDKELRVRAQQIQVLQGMTMQCDVFMCPNCGAKLLDGRGKAPEEDYHTRI